MTVRARVVITAHYLAAIDAAAIYIALPGIGAASVRGLRRLPMLATFSGWFGCVILPVPRRLLIRT